MFARLWDDQTRLVQDPPDRGGRWGLQSFLLQVPADRYRTGVKPLRAQPPAQLDHLSARPPAWPQGSISALESVARAPPDLSCRYRTRSRCRCRRENPYSTADRVTDSSPEATLRTATRARDMPAIQTPRSDDAPAIAATASPSGLSLRDDRRKPLRQVRPMPRLIRDVSPGTDVVNPNTAASACPVRRGRVGKTRGLLPARRRFDPCRRSLHALVVEAVMTPGPQPGGCGFEPAVGCFCRRRRAGRPCGKGLSPVP